MIISCLLMNEELDFIGLEMHDLKVFLISSKSRRTVEFKLVWLKADLQKDAFARSVLCRTPCGS